MLSALEGKQLDVDVRGLRRNDPDRGRPVDVHDLDPEERDGPEAVDGGHAVDVVASDREAGCSGARVVIALPEAGGQGVSCR